MCTSCAVIRTIPKTDCRVDLVGACAMKTSEIDDVINIQADLNRSVVS